MTHSILSFTYHYDVNIIFFTYIVHKGHRIPHLGHPIYKKIHKFIQLLFALFLCKHKFLKLPPASYIRMKNYKNEKKRKRLIINNKIIMSICTKQISFSSSFSHLFVSFHFVATKRSFTYFHSIHLMLFRSEYVHSYTLLMKFSVNWSSYLKSLLILFNQTMNRQTNTVEVHWKSFFSLIALIFMKNSLKKSSNLKLTSKTT